MPIKFGTTFMTTTSKDYDIIVNFSSNGSINLENIIFGDIINLNIIIINKSNITKDFTYKFQDINKIELCSIEANDIIKVSALSKSKLNFSFPIYRQINYNDLFKLSIYNNLEESIELSETTLKFHFTALDEQILLKKYIKNDSIFKKNFFSIINSPCHSIMKKDYCNKNKSLSMTYKNYNYKKNSNNILEINYGVRNTIIQEIDIKEKALYNLKFNIELQANEFFSYKISEVNLYDSDKEILPIKKNIEYNSSSCNYNVLIQLINEKLDSGKYYIKLTLNDDLQKNCI